MTANARVEVARRNGAVRVPNAALRFRPTAETFAALKQEAPPDAAGGGTRVWRYASNQLDPVRVQAGISDGVFTELVEPALQPGTSVAIGLAR
jgi:HlyD family secretion protein